MSLYVIFSQVNIFTLDYFFLAYYIITTFFEYLRKLIEILFYFFDLNIKNNYKVTEQTRGLMDLSDGNHLVIASNKRVIRVRKSNAN